jgi:hypothetical protein
MNNNNEPDSPWWLLVGDVASGALSVLLEVFTGL